jgi:putative oxidoreductase
MNLAPWSPQIAALAGGLLVLRVVLGLAMAAHGAQKLFGWFGGYGLAGTGGFFESIGFRPGRFFALAAGLGEAGAGVLTALGLLGPVGPAGIIVMMVVAAATVHLANGFFAANNGIELPLLYALGGATFALVGPGAYSLDALLGLQALSTPVYGGLAIGGAFLVGVANLALRRPAPVATAV